MRINQVLKRTLTAGMLALMACTSMSAMAEKQWVYAGPAKAVHDYGPDVIGNMDTICHDVVEMYYDVYVNKMYHLGLQTHPSEFVDAKFAWFSGGHDGDISRGLACYGKGRSYGWKGGVLMLLPENPVYGDTPASSFANISCDHLGIPNAGLYNGTLKEDVEGQRVGEYKLGCYEYREPKPCDAGYKPGRSFRGMVACNDQGYREVCAWMDGVKDPEAREIVHSCIERHEYLHIDYEYWKVYDNECFEGFLSNFSASQRYEQEYAANGDSVVCLMRGKKEQCSTSACRDEMDEHIESIETDMNYYASEYCKVTGNVSSNIITCH